MCSGGTVDDPDNSWQNREWWVLFSVLFPILLFWVWALLMFDSGLGDAGFLETFRNKKIFFWNKKIFYFFGLIFV